MFVFVLPQAGMQRLVVERQAEVGQVDQFGLEPAVVVGEGMEPVRHRGTDTARTGTGNDDVELQ